MGRVSPSREGRGAAVSDRVPFKVLLDRTAKLADVSFSLPLGHEVMLGAAVLLTLVGMLLHWWLPQERISIEELIKDGKLTEAEGRRRLRVFHVFAPLATIAGVATLLGELVSLAE
jgi:hypothetical protein